MPLSLPFSLSPSLPPSLSNFLSLSPSPFPPSLSLPLLLSPSLALSLSPPSLTLPHLLSHSCCLPFPSLSLSPYPPLSPSLSRSPGSSINSASCITIVTVSQLQFYETQLWNIILPLTLFPPKPPIPTPWISDLFTPRAAGRERESERERKERERGERVI